MKRVVVLLILVIGISNGGFAQTKNDQRAFFELQSNPFHRRFTVNLEKKNKVIVEVYSLDDLQWLQKIDSILSVFITDMERLKDSIPKAVYARIIEYSI